MSSRLTILLMIPVTVLAADEPAKPKYPPTRTDNVVDVLHGVKIVDPYRWLEDGDSKEVKDWVDVQNAFTQSVLGKVPARDAIRKRLENLLEIGSLGVPVPVKGRYFYTKREGTQNQPVLYVREGVQGENRVLVDPNAVAKDGTVSLDWWFPSKDGKLLAYGLSKDGSERSTLYLRDVATGKDLPDQIPGTRACSVAWLPEGNGFYYTRYPAPGTVAKGQENYNRHVFFHTLGDDPDKDTKIFGEGRKPEDWPTVSLSPDGRWLAVTVHQGWTKNEIYVRDMLGASGEFKPLVEGVNALFEVILRPGVIYVHTNHEAPRYRLYRVDPKKLERQHWQEIIPQGKDVLEDVAVVGETIAATYMHDAASRLRLHTLQGKLEREINLPTLGTVAGLGYAWDGGEVFFGFQSFTVAPSIYRLDLSAKDQSLWGRVKTDLDADAYQVQQRMYRSKDGTEVPMFLAYKKDMKLDGNNPTLLYGYGGFNISLKPAFSATRFLFLERGGVLAVANLRGGGEYGEDWHRAGMLANKQNTFDDFITAAERLIGGNVTRREKLVIQGGSNGGLLMGAALTQRPDLFQAVVCQVPLLDMTRFHKFLIARLWIPEYGDPDNAEHFQWIHAYSPYQKVKEGTAYPAVLLTTAASDTRVDPLHARKMAARLQAATASTAPILLRQETRAGHGAGKSRQQTLEEQIDVWSFVFSQLGLK